MYQQSILSRHKPVIAAEFVLAVVAQFNVFASTGSPQGEAKVIFRRRCAACHTFGKGIKVGPDLKGVTDRRERGWLLTFIQSSSNVIQTGDLVATRLFTEYKRERMPDWNDLSLDQIGGIVDYLAVNGPEQKEPDERNASTATTPEIEMGRRLFHGERPLTYGGVACHTCHGKGGNVSHADGTLGPDLRGVYVRFQDRALTDYLKRPCVSRAPEISSGGYLTPEESFDIKAYLAGNAASMFPATVMAGRAEYGKHEGEDALRAMRRDSVSSESGFLFGVWPYVTLAAFAAGAAARSGSERIRLITNAHGTTEGERVWRARKLWIVGFLILFLGHLVGLLFPSKILLWNAAPTRLYALEAIALAAGLGALAGWACMMWRCARGASGSTFSQLADVIFLSLLFTVLASALAAAVLYRWSSSWGALTAGPYVLSVLQGKPLVGLAEELPFLVRLHILSAVTLAPILPFTSTAPRLIQATYCGLERFFSPVRYLVQRMRMAWAEGVAKYDPRARIWPEED